MGSVLTGDNAGYPSPYDFALGGRGLDPALPGGANKTLLKEGQSVMVDLGGNFNGYMDDMSRVFSIGKLSEEAYAPLTKFVWISKRKSLRSPDRVLPVKCFLRHSSRSGLLPDLQINLWARNSRPNLSVTVSGLKLTKLRYWLPA